MLMGEELVEAVLRGEAKSMARVERERGMAEGDSLEEQKVAPEETMVEMAD